MAFIFVPHVVIKLLSVLERGSCCCKSIVCFCLHCVSGVYVCSFCYDKATVRSGRLFCCRCLFIVCYGLHCVSAVYVCSLCYDKATVRSGKVVLLSLFVHCLVVPSLRECGIWVPLVLL